jgi:hypothetical protein
VDESKEQTPFSSLKKDQVPKERAKDITYGSFSCDYKPNKEEKERTQLTAGGDRIN